MNQGAQPSGEWAAPETADAASPAQEISSEALPPMVAEPAEAPARPRWPARLATGAVLAAAALWIAALAWQLGHAASVGGIGSLQLAAWIGLGSGPLALLAILYLLLIRTGPAEINAYSRAAARLRADSESLAQMLRIVTERVEAAQRELDQQAGKLQWLGAEAAERLVKAAGELGGQAETIGRAAATFDDSTARARSDMGVLLTDLPRAEEAAHLLADRLRESGGTAEQRTRALTDLLEEMELRARQAGEMSGGAAARLATQLDRIEASAAAADRRIEEAATLMGRAVDAALEATAEGVEETRRAIASQSAALTAMTDQGRAALAGAGDDALRALGRRLDEVVARVHGIGAGMQGQELVARGLLSQLEQAIGAVEQRFAALGDKGAEHTADLAEMIVALADHADGINRTLGSNAQAADTLLARVAQLRQQTEASAQALTDTIPAALARIRLHAEQSLQAIGGAQARAEGLNEVVHIVGERLADAEALVARQRDALDAVGDQAGARLSSLNEQTVELEQLLAKASAEVNALSEGATGQLIEVLLRVRDTATQAAEHARDAISGAIPRAAQRLSESAARALATTVAEVGQGPVAELGQASERAVEAASQAAERLTRQLVTIAETSTAIEARIEENRLATEAHDDANFARSVSLLIEALNSTAIDLAKLFAHEVSDEQWKAYLRGDRGIFTRRAVRLLDRAEAGAVAQRYNEDEALREQVNRYIHDFEALLRRIMATREGEAIATTMLSSDAGKLYVALAQAIERLR